MNAIIERAPLLRALRLARAAVERRAADTPSVPGAVRLDADPVSGTLRLDATDGALALTLSLPAAVDDGWRRAVAAHPLAALVADLPDGPLTLAATDDTGGATLVIAAGEASAPSCRPSTPTHARRSPRSACAAPRCSMLARSPPRSPSSRLRRRGTTRPTRPSRRSAARSSPMASP